MTETKAAEATSSGQAGAPRSVIAAGASVAGKSCAIKRGEDSRDLAGRVICTSAMSPSELHVQHRDVNG
ncbi:MAG: hypothetical protein JW952_01005 [Candidatus Eisenbacteria bacterium]|nr:hypothetical protein [Candidatus Eisenbacteria bacterium]